MHNEQSDIEKYLRGELSPAEMHALERKALSDPFLREALEGGDSIPHLDFSADVDALNRKLQNRKTVWFTPLRIAAGVIVVSTVAIFSYVQNTQPENDLASVTKEAEGQVKAEQPATTSDSVVKSEPAKGDQLLSLNKTDKTTPSEKKQAEPTTYEPKTTKPAVVETEPVASPPVEAEEIKVAEKTDDQIEETTRLVEELKGSPKIADNKTKDRSEDSDRSKNVRKRAVAEASGAASYSIGKTIRGQVKSTDGQAMPGVTVLIKGTQDGTVSDIEGNYSIATQQTSPSLVFSFVGMQTSEVKANDTTSVDVTLREDFSQLSEVVVTGKNLSNRDEALGPVIRLAEPFGGRKAYDKYLDDNLKYPEQALEKKIKGRVMIEFSVGIDGTIGDFNVIKSLGYGCDEEVIRLVKDGPAWFPTTENDVAVESNVRVRMKFDPAKANK